MATVSSVYCAGPCEIHVGLGGGFAAPLSFLGWSEGGVTIDHQHLVEPVYTDLCGPRQPTTRQQLGEMATIRLDLKVFNWLVWDAVASGAGASVAPGYWPGGKMGAFDAEEGYAWRLCVFRPYAAKARNQSLGMPAAYNYGDAC